MAKKSKSAPVEEVEDDDVELEELDDDDTEDEAPKGKAKKAAADDVWGVQELIKLIKRKYDKDYTPREVRTLLRKMARDGKGRIEREIVAGNKSRYSWSGPEDPEVKRILKAVGGGEIEAGKKEALDKLKADKAAKTAAKGDADTKTKSAKKGKKTAAPPPDEDDDDDDLEEIDDDE